MSDVVQLHVEKRTADFVARNVQIKKVAGCRCTMPQWAVTARHREERHCAIVGNVTVPSWVTPLRQRGVANILLAVLAS